jgi:uncharacterized protein YabN with tetrapyrrole methylase and pyrophosphatase domain
MSGSLVCVGLGMTLGAHITPICRSHIEQADVVFSLMSNGLVELWLEEMHHDVCSLQKYYQEGKSRAISYEQMVSAIIFEVKAGKKVVGAFYGHPGVFAGVPHKAIETAQQLGFTAKMEAGISAEDCLIADLGIDPGKVGCQQYEASQFMFYRRIIDPCAQLILWQIGIVGDKSLGKFSTGAAYRQVLIDLLTETYPLNHPVILYEAKVLPIDTIRKETILLSELINAKLSLHTTLIIPPCKTMQKNTTILNKLAVITQQEKDKVQQVENS